MPEKIYFKKIQKINCGEFSDLVLEILNSRVW